MKTTALHLNLLSSLQLDSLLPLDNLCLKRVARVENFLTGAIVMRTQQLSQSSLEPNQVLSFPFAACIEGFLCCNSRLYSMSRTALVHSFHYHFTAVIDTLSPCCRPSSHQPRRYITPVSTHINHSFYPLAHNRPLLFTIDQREDAQSDLFNGTDFSYDSAARSYERIQHRQRKDSQCSRIIEFT